jgi:hypothetical protein
MASANYPVPRVLWESLETLLYAESRRYVKDLAGILDVNPDALLRTVMPSKDQVKVYLQDTTDVDPTLSCKAFVPLAGGELAARCRCPVVPGKESAGDTFCTEHQYFRPAIQPRMDEGFPVPKHLRRLRTGADLPALWVDADGVVYDAALRRFGYFDMATGKLQRITIKGQGA